MTIRQLIKELREYPADWEVFIEVQGREGLAKDVDMESDGVSAWVKIHDFSET